MKKQIDQKITRRKIRMKKSNLNLQQQDKKLKKLIGFRKK